MDEWMDGWMDGRMDEWMDGWMDGVAGHLCAHIGLWAKLEPLTEEHLIRKITSRESIFSDVIF